VGLRRAEFYNFPIVHAAGVLREGRVFPSYPCGPPMLKDYFDPKLRKIVPVIRRLRQVTVKFQVDEGYVPAL
jgi:hypothetical protein